jgi:hypothetical protein
MSAAAPPAGALGTPMGRAAQRPLLGPVFAVRRINQLDAPLCTMPSRLDGVHQHFHGAVIARRHNHILRFGIVAKCLGTGLGDDFLG